MQQCELYILDFISDNLFKNHSLKYEEFCDTFQNAFFTHKSHESKFPEKMWELFEAYRDWCKSNPRYQYSLSNKTGEATAIPLERPLVFEGFYNYCYDNVS